MNTTSGTTSNAKTVAYVTVPKKSNRLAAAYWWYLNLVCGWSRHYDGCILLNSWHRGGPLGRQWHRFVSAVMKAASDVWWEKL